MSEEYKPLDPKQVAKDIGLFLTQEEWNTGFQKIIDNNPIIINGETITPGQKGYDAGARRITSKYTFPTQKEYDDKKNEFQNELNKEIKKLQSKVDNGEISIEEANNQLNNYNKKWDNYQNGLIENEKNILSLFKKR